MFKSCYVRFSLNHWPVLCLYVVSTGFPGDVESFREDSGPDSEGAEFVDDK